MGKSRSSIQNEGNRNTNISGDGNTLDQRTIVNVSYESRFLPRTLLFEFCDKFSKIEVPGDVDNPKKPSEYVAKMEYNSIEVYRSIFLEVDHYYDDIEDILLEIVRRDRILSNINKTYTKYKGFHKGVDNDQICELVYDYLLQQTLNDVSFSGMFIEDTQEAIYALMYYAFTKCRLLDPVPDKQTYN